MKSFLDHRFRCSILYHISDIHIRLLSRREEYERVFQQLYEFLDHHPQKESGLIVITGDILHNKMELSPECILVTFYFLKRLASICPTIMIAGNHDMLVHNLDRVDSLTSILQGREPSQLFYLKETGYYQFGNVIFGVRSLFDHKDLETIQIPSSSIKVVLYHGQMYGWKNVFGFEMTESFETRLEDWSEFDYVLLGDIHRFQYMNKKKTIAYAGSLISQNFGETDPEHGVLVWDLERKESHYHILSNPYAFCKGKIMGEELEFQNHRYRMTDSLSLPKNGNVKLERTQETTEEQTKRWMQLLKQTYPKGRFHVEKQDSVPKERRPDLTYEDWYQESTIRRYIEEKCKQETKENREWIIQEIQREFGHFLQDQRNHCPHWEIESLEFESMFGYNRQPHRIEFSKLTPHTVVGIFGKNSHGKSSLIDILCFMLYGKITRGSLGNTIPKEIIRFGETESRGQLIFRVGSQRYKMFKKCIKKKDKIKIEEKLFLEFSDSEWRDISEEHRKKTDRNLERWIGSFENFIFTHLSLQQHEKSFRHLTQKERKDFLYELLGLTWFENYRKRQDEQFKTLKIQEKLLHTELEPFESIPWETEKQDLTDQEIQSLDEKKSLETKMEELEHILFETCIQTPCSFQSQEDIHRFFSEWELKFHQLCQRKQSLFHEKESFSLMESSPYDPILQKQSLLLHLSHLKEWKIPMHWDIYWTEKEWTLFYEKEVIRMENSSLITSKAMARQQEYEVQKHELLTKKETLVSLESTSDSLSNLLSRQEWKSQCEHKLQKWEREYQSLQSQWKQESERIQQERDAYHRFQSEIQPLFKMYHQLKMSREKYNIYQENYRKIQNMSFNESCDACRSNPYFQKQKHLLMDMDHLKQEEHECFQQIERSSPFSFSQFSEFESWIQEKEKESHRFSQSMIQQDKKSEHLQKRIQTLHQQIQLFYRSNAVYQCQDIDRLLQELDSQQKQDPILLESNQLLVTLEYWKWTQWIQEYMSTYHEFPSFHVEQIERQIQYLDQKDQEKVQFDHLSSQYDETCSQYESCLLQKQEGDIQKQIFEENRERIEKRQRLQKEMARLRNRWQMIQEKLTQIKWEQKEWDRRKKEWERIQHQTTTIGFEKKRLESLLSCIDREGLPLFLLQTLLPSMEQDMNQMVQGFLHKHILFECRGKDILIGFQPTSGSTEISYFMGGMESFMVDLSIKFVFAKYGKIPSSNFFFIDEGISVMDNERIQNIQDLFQFITSIIPHVFIISHLPYISDFVSQSILIEKNDSGSYLTIGY